MNQTQMKIFRMRVDSFYQDLEKHQETLEPDSRSYWKIQDMKAALADFMDA